MVKVTLVPSKKHDAPILVLIPGGPGLSSRTLRSLDCLSRTFQLCFLDLPGTNGVPFEDGCTFATLSSDIADVVNRLGKDVSILGHSFGGLFAAQVALTSTSVTKLICIAAPFSENSLRAVSDNYSEKMNPILAAAEKTWEESQNDKALANWFSEYDSLYFSESNRIAGKALLKDDSASARLFLALRKEAAQRLLPRLSLWTGKKLYISGQEDGIIPAEILREDAASGGFEFRSISRANHFVMFEQPESVARLIEEHCATGTMKELK